MITMAPPRPSRPRLSPPDPAFSPAMEPVRDARVPLIPGPDAASVARAQLRAAISSWRLPVDVDVAVLLVSELVTNAVTHGDDGTGAGGGMGAGGGIGGGTAITMLVRCSGGELRVEVHDRSREMPVPVSLEVPDDSETGRGLMLVDTLAAEWGYYRTSGGKAVYFTLLLHDSPGASPNGVARAR
jgi:anti-sigma regulatory factor (Ser/Thr protein kinase)